MAQPELGRLYQGVAKESPAFKLMKQMGWEEGQGLGKHKQGIATHVRVTKKSDTSGVGVAEARKEASNWTVNTAVFDAILKNLNIKARGGGVDADPANVGPATGSTQGDVAAARLELEQPGGRVQGGPEVGAAGGEEAAEGNAAGGHGAAGAMPRRPRPQGRYKRREAGKCVKSYSETDLSAILGVAVGVSSGAPAARSRDAPKQGTTRDGSSNQPGLREAPGSGPREGANGAESAAPLGKPEGAEEGAAPVDATSAANKSGTKLKPKPKPKLKKGLRPSASDPALGQEGWEGEGAQAGQLGPAPLPADWWGHRCGFVRGGALGSSARGKEEAEGERGFSEADQEGLYHLVNNTATSGRKGLGVGSLPKKVAGARWKGSKKTFGGEEGDSEEEGGSLRGRSMEEEERGQARGAVAGSAAGGSEVGAGAKTQRQSWSGPTSKATGGEGGDKRGDSAKKPGKRACQGEQHPNGSGAGGVGRGVEGEEEQHLTGHKRKRGEGEEQQCSGEAAAVGAGVVQWKKLIVRIVKKAAPDGISLQQLKYRALGLVNSTQQCGRSALEEQLQAKISRLHGKSILVEGDTVRLLA